MATLGPVPPAADRATSTRIARCHCGALSITATGDPRKVSLCHCFDCQRRTGSLFSIAAFFASEQIAIQGANAVFERPSASGFPVAFHFCPTCGTSLWWEARRLPELIGVAVGAFADPGFPMPEQAVWTIDQHAWLDLPATMPRHARNPVRPA